LSSDLGVIRRVYKMSGITRFIISCGLGIPGVTPKAVGELAGSGEFVIQNTI